jgi:FMN phosphatase YigB (HAD superfamily)
MEPLTPEELEKFLAKARAQGRLLTPEERAAIYGASAPTVAEPEPTVSVTEQPAARLEPAQVAELAHNFFPELPPHQTLPALRLVQGIIFDFDDTLAELTRPLDELMATGAQAAEQYMRSAGMELPAEFWPNIVEARRFAQEKSEEEQEEHLADDAMSFLLQFFGYPASKLDPTVLRTAVDLFYAPEMSAWRLRPGAVEMLGTLQAAGYKLALVTNYNCDRVFQRTVDYLGLRRFFDICLSSASVEQRKPDIQFFNLVLERWDALPYEVVVVGDSLLHDIQGGIELGALTVQCRAALSPQIAHNNAQLQDKVKPDAVIGDLSQLPAIVAAWAEDQT